MYNRWKEIGFALLLGLVCPALIFGLLEGREIPDTREAAEQTQLETAQEGPFHIPILMPDGKVSNMNLDDYLTAVVLQEMPASFEPEALKAQAVVARTYALRRYESGSKHENGAVCTNPDCCQGYKDPTQYLSDGGTQELLKKVSDAVTATSGQVLTYDGVLIDATYFSCSGGQTEDAKAVWGAEIPYLQSTDSPGEEQATHYVDTQSFSVEDFAQRLGFAINGTPEKWIENVTYTKGGGVDTVYICGKEFKGTTLRQKLGLRSTSMAISIVGDTVTVTTKGFGHRVGMSQYGADAMAIKGSLYPEILSHYYQGTELENYWAN